MVKGVKFVSIPVTDRNRAVEFHVGRMGFRSDDVEKTAPELKSSGVEFVQEAKQADRGTVAVFR